MTTGRRVGAAFLLLLALFLIVRATVEDRGVIVRNRIFAERLVEGTDPYEGGLHTPYPLAWALFHATFLPLPLAAARALWCAGQIGLLIAMCTVLYRCARDSIPEVRERATSILVITVLVTSRFWLRDMAGGGSNLLIAGLSLLGVLAIYRRQVARGAISLGLAIALKLTPVLFLPFLALQRRLRAAVATGVVALLISIAPAFVLGFEAWSEIAADWLGGVLRFLGQDDLTGAEGAIIPFEWMNQSLRNAMFRYLTELPPPHPLYRDVLTLSPEAATWIFRATAALLLAVSAIVLRPRRDGEDDPLRFAGKCGWIFVLMLLLSPISWRAHYVATIPALFVLAVHARVGDRGRIVSIALLVQYFLLVGGTNQELWGKDGKMLFQSYYTVTIATLAILPGLARVILDPRAFPRTRPPAPDGSSPATLREPEAQGAARPSSSESP